MAGLTYYARQPIFKKPWQRILSGLIIFSTATAIGEWVDRLCVIRYSSHTGRTSLYGDTTVRNGWLDSQSNQKNPN